MRSNHIIEKGILLFLGFIFLAASALIADERWYALDGPSGADVWDFDVSITNPNNLYVTDLHGGILASTDGGSNWFPTRNGLGIAGGNPGFSTVTIDPVYDSIVYTGNSDGLFKTTDSGNNWALLLDGVIPWQTAVDPQDHQHLIIATTTGIFYSTNEGANWDYALSGYFYTVLFNPLHPDTVIAFEKDSGVYRSVDGGSNWSLISSTLPTGRYTLIDIDPITPSILYAVSYSTSGTNYIYKSTNGGENWSIKLSDERYLISISVDKQNPANIWSAGQKDKFGFGAVVWKSTNYGENWTEFVLPTSDHHYVPFARTIKVDPTNSNKIFVGIPWVGILRSIDGGISWSAPHIPAAQTQHFVHYDTVTNYIYTSTMAGNLVRVTPGGNDWLMLTDSSQSRVHALAINPENHQEMFIASTWDGAVHKSTDGGSTWSQTSLYDCDVDAIVISPSSPNVLVAGVTNTTSYYGVWVSSNSGLTWSKKLTGQFYAVAIHPLSADTIFAANTGPMGENTYIRRTENRGTTWDIVFQDGSGGSGCRNLTFDPINPNIIYASGQNNGFIRSTDCGDNWDTNLGGFQGAGTIRGIAIDPQNGDIYMSLAEDFYTGKVYKSTDYGNNWTEMLNDGRWVVNTAVWCITAERKNDSLALIVGTRGCGLYYWDRLPGTGVKEKKIPRLTGLKTVLSVSPNPFRKKTEIKWTLGTGHSALGENPITNDQCPMTISIYDVSGRLVKSFSLFTPHSSLISSLSWDGTNEHGKEVAPGVYFIKIVGATYMLRPNTKKVIVIR